MQSRFSIAGEAFKEHLPMLEEPGRRRDVEGPLARSVCRAQADTEHKLSSWLVETFANSPLGLTAEQGAISLEYASASPDTNGAARPCPVAPCVQHLHPSR